MTRSVHTRATVALALAIGLAIQGGGAALAQPYRRDYHHPPPPYHGPPHGYAPNNNAGAAVAGALLGLGVGAILGSTLAAPAVAPPPPAYYPAPPPPAYDYSAPPPAYYGYGY